MTTPAWMDPARINDITIHCTATPDGRANTAAEVTSWDVARFGQPSYHYVIELDGKVVQTLRHDQRGAHTANHNTGNLGISYVGGTETLSAGGKPKDTRTPAQRTAMADLVRKLRGQYPNAHILGHRDWPGVTKACPSFDVATWLKSAGIAA